MTNLTVGQTVFVFQPETQCCRAHWVKTTVSRLFGDDEFETADAITTMVNSDQQNWSEFSLGDEGVGWTLEPTSNLEAQNQKFWARFFD